MSTSREVELKFEILPKDVSALEDSPLLSNLPCDRKRQTSIYFDTPDDRLRKAGLSLRIRESEGRYVQTVKVKADIAPGGGLFDREEYESPIPSSTPDLDGVQAPLEAKLGKKSLGRTIEPKFETIIDRSEWRIVEQDNEIELVLDRGEVAANSVSASIDEVELELLRGPAIRLFDLAHELNASVPLRVSVLTKSERGYRLLNGNKRRVTKAEPITLSPDQTTGEGFQAIAFACIRHFRMNESLFVDDRESAALHQMRVALRRLRSALSLFKSMTGDAELTALRDELRWISGLLGQGRDLDVFVQKRLDPSRRSPELWSQVLEQREAAFDAAIEAVNSERFRSLMIGLVQWLTLGKWRSFTDDAATVREQPLGKFASATLDRLSRRLTKTGRHLAMLEDDERHEVRIAGKKLRYASEFFASLYGDGKQPNKYRTFVGALEDLQEQLGSLNDLVTAQTLSAAIASSLTSVRAREELLGDQASNQVGERKKLLKAGEAAYDELIKASPFWR
jgi:triphosphatase